MTVACTLRPTYNCLRVGDVSRREINFQHFVRARGQFLLRDLKRLRLDAVPLQDGHQRHGKHGGHETFRQLSNMGVACEDQRSQRQAAGVDGQAKNAQLTKLENL